MWATWATWATQAARRPRKWAGAGLTCVTLFVRRRSPGDCRNAPPSVLLSRDGDLLLQGCLPDDHTCAPSRRPTVTSGCRESNARFLPPLNEGRQHHEASTSHLLDPAGRFPGRHG